MSFAMPATPATRFAASCASSASIRCRFPGANALHDSRKRSYASLRRIKDLRWQSHNQVAHEVRFKPDFFLFASHRTLKARLGSQAAVQENRTDVREGRSGAENRPAAPTLYRREASRVCTTGVAAIKVLAHRWNNPLASPRQAGCSHRVDFEERLLLGVEPSFLASAADHWKCGFPS